MSSAFAYAAYADAINLEKPLVFFVGSSLTYGYPWQERVIFSRVVAARASSWRVANLSYIGANMRGLLEYATCSLGRSIKPNILVVEIPLVNSIASLDSDKSPTRHDCQVLADRPANYWELVLTRPYGLGWVSLLWDEESYEKPEESIQIVKLPSAYFASSEQFESVKAKFTSALEEFLSAVSGMGDKVVVYVSPIYTPGIGDSGGDAKAVEAQIDLAYKICKKNGKVICINPSAFGLHREMFYNLTHLNQSGHRVLGEWFESHVLQSQKDFL